MLYDDITTGALIAGYQLNTGSITGEEASELGDALKALVAEHELAARVRLYVPGDSATMHAEDPERALFTSTLIVGVSIVTVEPWDAPMSIDPAEVEKRLDAVNAVPGAFWEAVRGAHELVPADFATGEPEALLTCWGPLPFAALSYGIEHPSDAAGDARYTFFSVQDMDQAWLPTGVDGVRVNSVDFTDVLPVDLSKEALAGLAEQVSDLSGAQLYMTVRYD